MAYSSFTPQELGSVLKRSVDLSLKVVAPKQYPLISMLPIVKASGQYKHEWVSSGILTYKTALTAKYTTDGSSTSGALTVSSTAGFAVNDTVWIGAYSTDTPEICYVTAINSATSMTVHTMSGVLGTHNSGATVYRVASRDAYGVDHSPKIQDVVAYDNNIQQFSNVQDIPTIQTKSSLANGQDYISQVVDQMIKDLKRGMDRQLLIGEKSPSSPSASTDALQAQGLVPMIIAGGGVADSGDLSSNVGDLIDCIAAIQDQDGLGGGNVMITDSKANAALYKLSYAAGGAVRIFADTQKAMKTISIGGVDFKYFVDTNLNGYDLQGTIVLLTASDYSGQPLVKRAVVTESLPERLKVSGTSEKISVVSYSTLELGSPEKSGVFTLT